MANGEWRMAEANWSKLAHTSPKWLILNQQQPNRSEKNRKKPSTDVPDYFTSSSIVCGNRNRPNSFSGRRRVGPDGRGAREKLGSGLLLLLLLWVKNSSCSLERARCLWFHVQEPFGGGTKQLLAGPFGSLNVVYITTSSLWLLLLLWFGCGSTRRS